MNKSIVIKVPHEDAELALKLLKEFFKEYPNNKEGIITQNKKSFYVYHTKTQIVARANY